MISLSAAVLFLSTAAAAEADQFKSAIDHLVKANSYTFELVRESRDESDREIPPILCKYQEGQPLQFIRGDQVLFRKGDEVVMKSVKTSTWRKVDLGRTRAGVDSRSKSDDNGQGGRGQGGSFDRDRFLNNLRRFAMTPMPHETMNAIHDAKVEITCAEENGFTTFSGELPVKAIIPLVGWIGQNEFLPNFEGTFQYFCKDDLVHKALYVVRVAADDSNEGKEPKTTAPREFRLKVTDVGTTTVDITVEGSRLFDDQGES